MPGTDGPSIFCNAHTSRLYLHRSHAQLPERVLPVIKDIEGVDAELQIEPLRELVAQKRPV